MKIWPLLLTLILFFIIPLLDFGQNCNNWAKITSSKSGIQIGDLDITGNQVTVEVVFSRTAPYSGSQLYAGDLVSKHEGPYTANYLLRPNSAEITTANGYFKTPDICDIELNKTYHVAMVYDGKILKFYRNGFLMSSIACTGSLFQNDYITSIGTFAYDPNITNENLVGYINEVRIWKIARSQSDIKKYMYQSLPNPSSQVGLLAYYTFDNLKNKQGNTAWNGSIIGNASINQSNPTCSSFAADSCGVDACNIQADFKYVQTTCDSKSVHFQSTTLNADSIWWDFGNGKKAGNISDTTIQYAAYGNFFVKLFAKTNTGCLDTAEYTIDVKVIKDSAVINNDTTVCSGSSVYLNAIKGLNYCWSPSAGLSNTSVQNPVASPAATTKYYLHILTDSSKPVIMDSVLITVLSLPSISVSDDTTLCGNALVQLTASGAASYVWSPAAGLSNPNIPNPVASPLATTTYYVTATGNNSCTIIDSVTIMKQPVPVFTLTPQNAAICKEDSVLLTALGGDIFNWVPTETVANPDGASTTAFPITNTTYKVIITNSVCKITDTMYADVSVKELPVIIISKSNDVDCINYHAQLIATGGLSYKWSPGTYINNTTIYNPVVNPPADTWYAVEVKGSNNCYNTDSILVKSAYNPADTKFEIATAFTPNHDGLNDCFSVKYWGFADSFDMSIYDRWGHLVFHSNNINNCWDGTVKGIPQNAGTFVYQINVSSKCTEGILHKKGTLVLIR